MNEDGIEAIAAIGLLTDMASSNIFNARSKPVSDRKKLKHISDLYLTNDNRLSWALLEGIVVFEKIHYDAYAFSRHKIPTNDIERIEFLHDYGLSRTRWPIENYKIASEAVSLMKNKLSSLGFLEEAKGVPAQKSDGFNESGDPFWEAKEKDYHDDLFSSEVAQYSFAETSESYERAIFYAELSSALGMSMLPRPFSKGSIVETIWQSNKRCIHKLLQNRLEDFDSVMRPAELKLKFPPLAQSIISQSLRQARSTIDVAVEMRQSSHAKAYRKHLFHLNKLLKDSDLTPKSLKNIFSDFDNIVEKWVADCATGEGVEYRTRSINLQLIPAVATIAAFIATRDLGKTGNVALATSSLTPFFGDSIVVRHPILWGGDKYLSFVADWYH